MECRQATLEDFNMNDQYTRVMVRVLVTVLVAFAVMWTALGAQAYIWLPIGVQGITNGANADNQLAAASIKRADSAEQVVAGFFNAGRDFILGKPKQPEFGLPPLMVAVRGTVTEFGKAATAFAGSATELDSTLKKVNQPDGTIDKTNSLLVTINTTFTKANGLIDGPLTGSFKNVALVTSDIHAMMAPPVSVRCGYEDSPTDNCIKQGQVLMSLDLVNSMFRHADTTMGYGEEIGKHARDTILAPFKFWKWAGMKAIPHPTFVLP